LVDDGEARAFAGLALRRPDDVFAVVVALGFVRSILKGSECFPPINVAKSSRRCPLRQLAGVLLSVSLGEDGPAVNPPAILVFRCRRGTKVASTSIRIVTDRVPSVQAVIDSSCLRAGSGARCIRQRAVERDPSATGRSALKINHASTPRANANGACRGRRHPDTDPWRSQTRPLQIVKR
jgi:hypothetical protein